MLYSTLPGILLGFHGCDQELGEKVLAGEEGLRSSENDYDWLGDGVYFWENNPERALQFAKEGSAGLRGESSKIKAPFVIGAAIDLGHCLNFFNSESLEEVKEAHRILKDTAKRAGYQLPKNQEPMPGRDSLLRKLDCAVIRSLHAYRKAKRLPRYDSVRGVFGEGKELFEGTTLREKNHIQISVRNPNCIKGYFRVRQTDMKFALPGI